MYIHIYIYMLYISHVLFTLYTVYTRMQIILQYVTRSPPPMPTASLEALHHASTATLRAGDKNAGISTWGLRSKAAKP